MALKRSVGALVLSATALGACQSLLGFDRDDSDRAADAAAGDAALHDGTSSTDGDPTEGGSGDVDPRVDAPVSCVSAHGPQMIAIVPPQGTGHAFCIDSTEVTRKQYGEFLVEMAGAASDKLPSVCSFKTTHAQSCIQIESDPDDFPARCIDWCDAHAFCTWAGKRLCGNSFDGGPLAFGETNASEMHVACSTHGANLFSYGASFETGRCNVGSVGPAATSSFPGCATPGGVLDMIGNIGEFENSCASDFPDAKCKLRGGDFGTPGTVTCLTLEEEQRNRAQASNGIRCCRSL